MARIGRLLMTMFVLAFAAGALAHAANATDATEGLASNTAVQMSVRASSDVPTEGCDGTLGGSGSAVPCAAMCASPLVGLAPETTWTEPLAGWSVVREPNDPLVDRLHPPDPPPPRFTVLS